MLRIILLMLLAATSASGATVLLVAYVSTAIYEQDGITALGDGSVIQIIGSQDNVADGLRSHGDCYISDSTMGDDIILGTTTIDSNDLGAPGTFLSAEYTFEFPEIRWVYLRVFNTTGSVTGVLDWTVSSVFKLQPFFGVAEVDFVGGFSTDQTDCFVIIPEPGTASLVLMGIIMAFAIRQRVSKCKPNKGI